MFDWDCCRMCLSKSNLTSLSQEESYLKMVYLASGVKIALNDQLPQQICMECSNFIGNSCKFREKCQSTQNILLVQIKNHTMTLKIERQSYNEDPNVAIEEPKQEMVPFNDLILRDNLGSQYYDDATQSITDESTQDEKIFNHIDKNECTNSIHNTKPKPLTDTKKTKVRLKTEKKKNNRIKNETKEKKIKKIKSNETIVCNEKTTGKRVKEEIKCDHCDKVLTSKTSLRNHYKIHTGFDIVCEHCGKKFITKRLLLMHCKAKHGYEKTDKCSFCDYRACNSEQVKIHERIHTGERPFVCKECDASFLRNSCYLQHIAIHLPEKTVQCEQCPARFKSVTLMKIHLSNRHRTPQYSYKCYVCDSSFVRRRNVLRHLQRIHSVLDLTMNIERVAI